MHLRQNNILVSNLSYYLFIYLFYMYLVTYLSTLLVIRLNGVKLHDEYSVEKWNSVQSFFP